MFLVILAVVMFNVLMVYGLRLADQWKLKEFKGPWQLWMLGNLHQIFILGLEKFFLGVAEKYDSVCKVFFGGIPILVVSDADFARPILTQVKRRYQMAGFGSTDKDWEQASSTIFWAEGQKWKDCNKVYQPFFAIDNIKRCMYHVSAAADRLVACLENSSKAGESVGLFRTSELAIMQVVMSSMMGLDTDVFAKQKDECVSVLFEASENFWKAMGLENQGIWVTLMHLFPEYKPQLMRLSDCVRDKAQRQSNRAIRLCEKFGEIEAKALHVNRVPRSSVYETIANLDIDTNSQRPTLRNSILHPSKLSLMNDQDFPSDKIPASRHVDALSGTDTGTPNSARSEASSSNSMGPPSILIDHLRQATPGGVQSKSKQERDWVAHNALVAFLAGYDTAAITLTYLIYHLAQPKHAHIQQKIQEEVDRVGFSDDVLTEDGTKVFPYINACIQETMRLYPSSPTILRQTEKAMKVEGKILHADQRVIINVVGIHRSPRYWDKPEEFIPERFVRGSGVPGCKHPWAYLPFGAGARRCIGYKFAIQELIIIVAKLFQNFSFTLEPGQVPVKSKIEMVYHPAKEIQVQVNRRENVAYQQQGLQKSKLKPFGSQLNLASMTAA